LAKIIGSQSVATFGLDSDNFAEKHLAHMRWTKYSGILQCTGTRVRYFPSGTRLQKSSRR